MTKLGNIKYVSYGSWQKNIRIAFYMSNQGFSDNFCFDLQDKIALYPKFRAHK